MVRTSYKYAVRKDPFKNVITFQKLRYFEFVSFIRRRKSRFYEKSNEEHEKKSTSLRKYRNGGQVKGGGQ